MALAAPNAPAHQNAIFTAWAATAAWVNSALSAPAINAQATPARFDALIAKARRAA